jgi:hypothetical protein
MTFRETELLLASLEGKHAALDDEKDRGHFFMCVRRDKGADKEYWHRFYDAYINQMNKMEAENAS